MSILNITSKKSIDFYNNHKNIDPNVVSDLVVDLLENLLDSDSLNSSISSQILSTLSNLKDNIDTLKTFQSMTRDTFNNDLQNMKDIVSRLSFDINNNFTNKIYELRQIYIDDVKTVLAKSDAETLCKVMENLERQNIYITDKITKTMNDILPKSTTQVDEIMSTFHNTISKHTSSVIDSLRSDLSITDIVNTFTRNIDSSLHNLTQHIQTPINTYISSSEERLRNNISQLKDSINPEKQNILFGELSEFLNRFKNSSFKGQYGENLLYNVLNSVFPCAEIINTTTDGSKSADFIMKRVGYRDIMFENKDYSRNASSDEVRKFVRDVEKSPECNGIFLSQSSGIANIPNWHIEIKNKQIMLYIHNVEYSSDKIKQGVDIIDQLSEAIKIVFPENNSLSDDTIISKQVLDEINREYDIFIKQKDILINILKEFTKSYSQKITDIQLPNLKNILDKCYGSLNSTIVPQQYTCSNCKIWSSKTLKALEKHKLICGIKENNDDNETLSDFTDSFLCELCNVWNGKSAKSLSNHKRYCSKKHNQ